MRFFILLFRKISLVIINNSNEKKINYLKKHGCKIGVGCKLNCNTKTFGTEPYLISIGNNCLIAEEVRLITHDGGIFVLNNMKMWGEEKKDKIAPISIGNNVYIGTGAFIMPGVRIGNNCVIGAKAVVTSDVPDNSVVVGIPARVVEPIEKYYENTLKKGNLYNTVGMPPKEKRDFFKNIDLNTKYWE